MKNTWFYFRDMRSLASDKTKKAVKGKDKKEQPPRISAAGQTQAEEQLICQIVNPFYLSE